MFLDLIKNRKHTAELFLYKFIIQVNIYFCIINIYICLSLWTVCILFSSSLLVGSLVCSSSLSKWTHVLHFEKEFVWKKDKIQRHIKLIRVYNIKQLNYSRSGI